MRLEEIKELAKKGKQHSGYRERMEKREVIRKGKMIKGIKAKVLEKMKSK